MTIGEQENRKNKNVARTFLGVGWAVGFLFSLLLPQLMAPLEPALPFKLAGTMAGIAGFALLYVSLKGSPIKTKWLLTLGTLVVGLGAAGWYRSLVLSAEFTTPSLWNEWLELFLFCVAWFAICGTVASVYRNGGSFMLQKFGKIAIE